MSREKGKHESGKSGVSQEKGKHESVKREARVGKKEGASRENEKARIGKKRRLELGTKNMGKGKAVRQLTSWMLGYSPQLMSAPSFACVTSSYLSQHEKRF